MCQQTWSRTSPWYTLQWALKICFSEFSSFSGRRGGRREPRPPSTRRNSRTTGEPRKTAGGSLLPPGGLRRPRRAQGGPAAQPRHSPGRFHLLSRAWRGCSPLTPSQGLGKTRLAFPGRGSSQLRSRRRKGLLTCLIGMARPLPILSTLHSVAFFSRSKSAPFRDWKRKEEVRYRGQGAKGGSCPPGAPSPPRLPPPGQALAVGRAGAAGPGRN